MHFRLEWTIRDLSLRDKKLKFSFGGAHEITVSLRAPTEAEQKEGHERHNAFCTATSKQEVKADNREMFDRIFHNGLPQESKPPESYEQFAEQISKELSDYARRTVSVLRWRCAWKGPHNPISSRGLYWSFDGENWKTMPGGIRAYLELGSIGGACF